jgi:hypothetical protein
MDLVPTHVDEAGVIHVAEKALPDHPHHFVYAGVVKEESGRSYERWPCASPGCEEEDRRNETE